MIHKEINKIKNQILESLTLVNKGILFSNQKNVGDTKLGFTRSVVANSTKAKFQLKLTKRELFESLKVDASRKIYNYKKKKKNDLSWLQVAVPYVK